jgi:hypothetical protein
MPHTCLHLNPSAGTSVRGGPRYPYPVALLRRYDIFDLFVLDGGAFFYSQERLGGTDSARFLAAFDSGRLLAPWTGGRRCAPDPQRLQWFAAYDPEQGPWAPGQRCEEHVWLHRLYFLLPLAQAYLRTGSPRRARQWYAFFAAWRERFPAFGDRPTLNPKHSAQIWDDMQPTWRLLVLLHSMAMLRGRRAARPVLSPREWERMDQAIAVHARWVHAEVRLQFEGKHNGNHFLQKGTALLYAGLLFPERPPAAQWVATGREVIRDQLRREINADGGSIEGSPSYSHFIARLYFDAWRLLADNRQKPIAGLEASLRRQYDFLEASQAPDGKTLQVGDSYALDVRRDLSIVRPWLPRRAPAGRRSRLFAHTRLAHVRSARAEVFVDAMDIACWHVHPAKPNVLAYHDGRPVLVDCGSVNYDRPDFQQHFRGWAAHNVVVPAAFLAKPPDRRQLALRVTRFAATGQGGEVACTCRCTDARHGFVWKRVVRLEQDRLTLIDRVAARRRTEFCLFLHLAPGARPRIRITGRHAELRLTQTRQAAIDARNAPVRARVITARQTGRDLIFKTVIALDTAFPEALR